MISQIPEIVKQASEFTDCSAPRSLRLRGLCRSATSASNLQAWAQFNPDEITRGRQMKGRGGTETQGRGDAGMRRCMKRTIGKHLIGHCRHSPCLRVSVSPCLRVRASVPCVPVSPRLAFPVSAPACCPKDRSESRVAPSQVWRLPIKASHAGLTAYALIPTRVDHLSQRSSSEGALKTRCLLTE